MSYTQKLTVAAVGTLVSALAAFFAALNWWGGQPFLAIVMFMLSGLAALAVARLVV